MNKDLKEVRESDPKGSEHTLEKWALNRRALGHSDIKRRGAK